MAYNFIHIKQMENYIVNHIHIYRIILSYSIHTYEMYESAAKISQIYTESWRRFPLYAFWASFMLLRLSFSNVSWDTRLILIWKNKNIKKKKNKCGHGNSFGYFSRTLILHELSLSQTAIDWHGVSPSDIQHFQMLCLKFPINANFVFVFMHRERIERRCCEADFLVKSKNEKEKIVKTIMQIWS